MPLWEETAHPSSGCWDKDLRHHQSIHSPGAVSSRLIRKAIRHHAVLYLVWRLPLQCYLQVTEGTGHPGGPSRELKEG